MLPTVSKLLEFLSLFLSEPTPQHSEPVNAFNSAVSTWSPHPKTAGYLIILIKLKYPIYSKYIFIFARISSETLARLVVTRPQATEVAQAVALDPTDGTVLLTAAPVQATAPPRPYGDL